MLKRHLVFHGMDSNIWFGFLVAAAVVSAICIMMLFRYERRLISPGLGWILLLLRTLLVVLVFAILLEPVLAWTVDKERSGRVVVAVDVSGSMETKDSHASKAERLRVARALGMIGNAKINERLDRWVKAYEQDQEPEWVGADEGDPALRADLAKDRQATLDGIFAELAKLSRKDIARRLLLNGTDPLLKQLQKLVVVDTVVFAGEQNDTDEQELVASIEKPGEGVRPDTSDLTQVLTAAAAQGDGLPTVGVVALTDGRDTAHASGQEYLSRFSGGVPIYSVLIGSQRRPKDLAVAVVDCPSVVFQNDKPVIKAVLRTPGFEGQNVEVVLEREDPSGAKEAPIRKTIMASGATTEVDFELDAKELGRRNYRVKVTEQEGETRTDNNARSFAVRIVDDKTHVLLLDDEARWEFRYLEAALRRDDRVLTEKVVFRQPYMGKLPDTFFPRSLKMPVAAPGGKESPFQEFDAVILGDVAATQLSTAVWENLDKFVREKGGTLILTAGKRHFPLTYKNSIVDSLLPITNLRAVQMNDAKQTGTPSERGFHLHLTADGERQASLQFHEDVAENRKIWKSLPGHQFGIVGEKRGGASVWASTQIPGQPETVEFENQNGLIVHHFVGAGQVLWVGIDSTWRWRFRVGDKYHHRFWGQLVRWAASFKASAGNEHVRFGIEKPNVERGQPAVTRARFESSFLLRNPELKAKAVFLRNDGGKHEEVQVLPLIPNDGQATIFEARTNSLRPGEYTVELRVENANLGEKTISTDLVVTEHVTAELADVSANPDLLKQIGSLSGGKMFLPDEVNEIPKLFQDVKQKSSTREEEQLWDSWLALLVFCAVAMAEWVLRKVNGLP